jgi:hypothetical protein
MTMLEEWKSKPKNGYFYLLEEQGDKTKIREQNWQYKAKNVTCGMLVVYNAETDRVSTKSIYINSKGRFYVKGGAGHGEKKMFFLDEFK